MNYDFDFDFNNYTNQLKQAYQTFEPLKRRQREWETDLQTDAQKELSWQQKDIQKELAEQSQGFNLEQLNAQFGNQKELANLEQGFGLERLGKQTESQKELARQSNDFQVEQARLNSQLRLEELGKQSQYNLANQMASGITGFLFS